MLAYLGPSTLPSRSSVPGNVPCRNSDAPQPSKPAVAAMAKTLDTDHVDAVRGSWSLLGAARRRGEVVKGRLARTQERRAVTGAVTGRPAGLAALRSIFADMQETLKTQQRSLQHRSRAMRLGRQSRNTYPRVDWFALLAALVPSAWDPAFFPSLRIVRDFVPFCSRRVTQAGIG